MKIIFVIFCLSGLLSANAQRPSGIYYFDNRVVTEKKLTGSLGQLIGTQDYSVRDLNRAGNIHVANGQNIQIKNGKESEVTQSSYRIDGSVLRITMGKGNGDRDVSIDYPTDINATLTNTDNIDFYVMVRLAGINKKIYCRINNRKVLSRQEQVASPAGVWNCVKSGYDMELKCFGIPYRIYVMEWFAPDTGIIRTDIYRNGKLYERRLINRFRPAVS